jgi:hypothetical protein
VKLTDQEWRLLNGEKGEIKALAMSCLVKLGNAFDGQEMVDILYAHMSSGSALREGEIDYLEELAGKGSKVIVPTSSEVIPVDLLNPQAICAPPDLARSMFGSRIFKGRWASYRLIPASLSHKDSFPQQEVISQAWRLPRSSISIPCLGQRPTVAVTLSFMPH